MKHIPVFYITPMLIWILCSLTPTPVAAHEAAENGTFQMKSSPTSFSNTRRQEAKQFPTVYPSKLHLGEALMQIARETGNLSDYTKAKSAFKTALDHKPDNIAAMVGMAWSHAALHEFDASIHWAKRVVASDFQNPEAYGLLGDAAVEMGDYDAAFDHYQKMLNIRPDLSSYSRGAHLLFITGDIHSAIGLMKKAIVAGAPFAENTAWCRGELARMLWCIGRLSEAEKVVERGLEEAPDNYKLLVTMGMVKAAKNETAAAITAYEIAIGIRPGHDTIAALATLYAGNSQPEKAQFLIEKVKKSHQLNQAAGLKNDISRARFYADNGIQSAAALEEAKGVYVKYKNIFVADTLAWCYYRAGRYQSARNLIETALRFRTPDPNIWFHAGMIYSQLGEKTLARKHLNRALTLNPSFHPVYAPTAQKTLIQQN